VNNVNVNNKNTFVLPQTPVAGINGAVPIPIVRQPSETTPIVIQNNGHCLTSRKVDGRLEVQLNPAQQSLRDSQTAWYVRGDNRIMSKEFGNQCLGRSGTSQVVLCACNSRDAVQFNVNFRDGRFIDTRNNQVLNMGDNGRVVNFVPQQQINSNGLPGASNLWTTYAVETRPVPLQPVNQMPQLNRVFSVQYGDQFLVSEMQPSQPMFSEPAIRFTSQPNPLQRNNWAFIEGNRLINLVHKQCLNLISQNDLRLSDCNLPRLSTWEFRPNDQILVERNSGRALQMKANRPVFVDLDGTKNFPQRIQIMMPPQEIIEQPGVVLPPGVTPVADVNTDYSHTPVADVNTDFSHTPVADVKTDYSHTPVAAVNAYYPYNPVDLDYLCQAVMAMNTAYLTNADKSINTERPQFLPVPVFQQPREQEPVMIQNNGWGLRCRQQGNDFQVFLEPARDALHELEAWLILPDGRVRSRQFENLCLGRLPMGISSPTNTGDNQPALSMCPCDEKRAIRFDINFDRGVFRDRETRRVLNILESLNGNALPNSPPRVNWIDERTDLPLPRATNSWTIYRVQEPARNAEFLPIRRVPTGTEPVSLLYGNEHLVSNIPGIPSDIANAAQTNRPSPFTQIANAAQPDANALLGINRPSPLQQQNWVIQPDNTLFNLVQRQCLSCSGSHCQLSRCENPGITKWDYNPQQGTIQDIASKQFLHMRNNQLILDQRPQLAASGATPQRWQAMRMSSDGVAANNRASSANSQRPIQSIITGAAFILITLAVY
jgi:hypothetical protein